MNNQHTTQTLNYYNQNAAQFSDSTQSLDFASVQDKFLSFLQPQDTSWTSVAAPEETRNISCLTAVAQMPSMVRRNFAELPPNMPESL